MLSALVLLGAAVRLRASKAMVRSTQAAGRLALNVSMKFVPNIRHSMASKARSTPTAPYGPPEKTEGIHLSAYCTNFSFNFQKAVQ